MVQLLRSADTSPVRVPGDWQPIHTEITRCLYTDIYMTIHSDIRVVIGVILLSGGSSVR